MWISFPAEKSKSTQIREIHSFLLADSYHRTNPLQQLYVVGLQDDPHQNQSYASDLPGVWRTLTHLAQKISLHHICGKHGWSNNNIIGILQGYILHLSALKGSQRGQRDKPKKTAHTIYLERRLSTGKGRKNACAPSLRPESLWIGWGYGMASLAGSTRCLISLVQIKLIWNDSQWECMIEKLE